MLLNNISPSSIRTCTTIHVDGEGTSTGAVLLATSSSFEREDEADGDREKQPAVTVVEHVSFIKTRNEAYEEYPSSSPCVVYEAPACTNHETLDEVRRSLPLSSKLLTPSNVSSLKRELDELPQPHKMSSSPNSSMYQQQCCVHSDDETPELISEDAILATPPPRTIAAGLSKTVSPSPLTSCLKKKKKKPGASSLKLSTTPSSTFRPRPSTGRRVRGLWSPKDCIRSEDYFQLLRDDTLSKIFEYLNLADLCRASMVVQRWKYVVHDSKNHSLWKQVDATKFVQEAFETFSKGKNASKRTGQALEQVLQNMPIQSLTIRDIGTKLSANHYLPTLTALQELTLTNFENLTDTHVHVMMLMNTLNQNAQHQQHKPSNAADNLKRLTLKDCQLLTNASIRSIALKCTNLKSICLEGNSRMDDMGPLCDLIVTTQTKKKKLEPTPPKSSSFSGMFSSPNTKSSLPLVASLFAPPQTFSPPPPPSNSNSLQALFGPPPTTSTAKTLTPLQSLFGPPPTTAATVTTSKPATSSLQPLFGPPQRMEAAATTSKPATSKNNSLQSLFGPPQPPTMAAATASKPATGDSNSLQSLFGPPQPPTAEAATSESPSPPSTPTAKTSRTSPPRTSSLQSLQSLFALPGTSPRRKKQVLQEGQNMTSMIPILGGGKLLSINMKGTGLSPKQVLQSMECSECCIALNTLEVNGDCWTNSDVQELANNLDLQKLEHLDLECCNSGSGKLTNQGVLFALRDSSNLGYLNLRGHDNCTTHVLRQTFPNAHIIAIQERLECLL